MRVGSAVIAFELSSVIFVDVNSPALSRALKVPEVSADLVDGDSEFQRVSTATESGL